MEYPTDIRLNENKDIYIDAAGDIATIGGFEQLQQSVALDALDVLIDFIGSGITGRNVGLLEERVTRALADDEQVGEVRTVNVTEYNQESGIVRVEVELVENEDFTLELSA